MRKININKKPLSILIVLIALVTGIVFQSCQNDETLDISEDGLFFEGKHFSQEDINIEARKISKMDILKALNKQYGISKVSKLTNEFPKSTKSNNMNLDENAYQIIEYEFEKSNDHLYIAQNIESPNEYQIIKTTENNNEQKILNRVTLYHDKLISISLKLNHKEFMKSKEFNLSSLFALNVANAEWCQQEPDDGGSSSACQDREYDEFTDDWIGFVAYWSNPQISILIAAMCRC